LNEASNVRRAGFLTEVNAVDLSCCICGTMKKLCFALLTICACSNAGYALDREQQHGKALLETLCGRCHAVGKTGKSPDVAAPPFRTFGDDKLYDNDFGQRLQDGLTTIHPNMPTFRFDRVDAEAAVNYLKSIQGHKQSK
jgi:mono/diheme cytochrome c family protein